MQPLPMLPQAHDPHALMARWRRLAKLAHMKVKVLVELEGEKIFYLESQSKSSAPFYLSAGVHGDEAAAPWGLLRWGEAQVQLLRENHFLIFPCLNPHGLRANTRLDHRGLDLNRRFHLQDDPLCGPWYRVLSSRVPPTLALCLHEDYDAAGSYVYEFESDRAPLGASCLQAAAVHLPVDLRSKIDGRRAKQGIILRSRIPQQLPGLPEAVVLRQLGCPRTLTFETPSECAFIHRVQAHAAFVHSAVERTLADSH